MNKHDWTLLQQLNGILFQTVDLFHCVWWLDYTLTHAHNRMPYGKMHRRLRCPMHHAQQLHWNINRNWNEHWNAVVVVATAVVFRFVLFLACNIFFAIPISVYLIKLSRYVLILHAFYYSISKPSECTVYDIVFHSIILHSAIAYLQINCLSNCNQIELKRLIDMDTISVCVSVCVVVFGESIIHVAFITNASLNIARNYLSAADLIIYIVS